MNILLRKVQKRIIDVVAATPLSSSSAISRKKVVKSRPFTSSSPSVSSSSSSSSEAPTIALVFDTETTGKINRYASYDDPTQPHLCQLGLILVDTSDWTYKSKVSMLVKLDGASIETGAYETHGISEDDCNRYGISIKAASSIFLEYCQNADILVAHNLEFDKMVMSSTLYRSRLIPITTKVESFFLPPSNQFCTMTICTDILKIPSPYREGQYKWPKLEEAYSYFTSNSNNNKNNNNNNNNDNDDSSSINSNSVIRNAHDALADADACVQVLRGLVKSGAVDLNGEHIRQRRERQDEEGEEFYDLSSCYKHLTGWDHDDIVEEEVYSLISSSSSSSLTSVKNNSAIATKATILSSQRPGVKKNQHEQNFSMHNNNNNINTGTAVVSATGGGLIVELYGNSYDHQFFRVRGNTYHHREQLKALGGIWEPQRKAWRFDISVLDIVQNYVKDHSKQQNT